MNEVKKETNKANTKESKSCYYRLYVCRDFIFLMRSRNMCERRKHFSVIIVCCSSDMQNYEYFHKSQFFSLPYFSLNHIDRFLYGVCRI